MQKAKKNIFGSKFCVYLKKFTKFEQTGNETDACVYHANTNINKLAKYVQS